MPLVELEFDEFQLHAFMHLSALGMSYSKTPSAEVTAPLDAKGTYANETYGSKRPLMLSAGLKSPLEVSGQKHMQQLQTASKQSENTLINSYSYG